MDAPLSSPTQTRNLAFQNSYFAQHASSSQSSSSSSSNNQAQHQTQPQAPQQQIPPPQQQQQSQQRPANTDNTSHFLQDFNLVAEAAKRAQMAVLMRDLEAVGI